MTVAQQSCHCGVILEEHLRGCGVTVEEHLRGCGITVEAHLRGCGITAEEHLRRCGITVEAHLRGCGVAVRLILILAITDTNDTGSGAAGLLTEWTLIRSYTAHWHHLYINVQWVKTDQISDPLQTKQHTEKLFLNKAGCYCSGLLPCATAAVYCGGLLRCTTAACCCSVLLQHATIITIVE